MSTTADGRADPFTPDPAAAARVARVAAAHGDAITARLGTLAGARDGDAADDDGIVLREEATAIVEEFDLGGIDDLMLLALPRAAQLARPAISGYVVGAVGREKPSGHLLLGGNVEFPGTSLGLTLHGEGSVALRAFGRGTALSTLAITRARPCAHCRQVLTEFAWAGDLALIDPLGHRVRLADLYPWPFSPEALGMDGVRAAAGGSEPAAPPLAVVPDGAVPPALAGLLAEAGARAHAPYSGARAAAVLELADGRLVAGASLESVAYNPSIGPIQAAIPEVIARGHEPSAIRAAWLAVPASAPVDHAAVARQLLGAVAPHATLHVIHWT